MGEYFLKIVNGEKNCVSWFYFLMDIMCKVFFYVVIDKVLERSVR